MPCPHGLLTEISSRRPTEPRFEPGPQFSHSSDSSTAPLGQHVPEEYTVTLIIVEMHYYKIGIKNGYAPLGLYISSYMDTIDYGPTTDLNAL